MQDNIQWTVCNIDYRGIITIITCFMHSAKKFTSTRGPGLPVRIYAKKWLPSDNLTVLPHTTFGIEIVYSSRKDCHNVVREGISTNPEARVGRHAEREY